MLQALARRGDRVLTDASNPWLDPPGNPAESRIIDGQFCVWDDGSFDEFGQIWIPVCPDCRRGPLDKGEYYCGGNLCIDSGRSQAVVSYCRFIEGDAYIFATRIGDENAIECCACTFGEPSGLLTKSFFAHSTDEMVEHVQRHIEAGDNIPGSVIPDLHADDENNFPEMEARQ